jgi:monoamine oxidase
MSTLVIGAGVAGLAAARDLAQARESVTVLEARSRIGGRVHTNRDFAPYPVEFGAEYIHGENVASWELVRNLNLNTVHARRSENSPVRLADGAWHIMAEALRLYPDFRQVRLWQLPDVPPLAGDEDLGSYLRRAGYSDAQLRYVSRMFANATGESLANISALAVLKEINDATPGQDDWRILDGYDRLVDGMAEGLDIRLNTVVERIAWDGDSVRVDTHDGSVYEAERVVITLPLGVLQNGDVRFEPELPLEKQTALARLRMGPVIKMVYRFDEPLQPASVMAIYSAHNPPMWWTPSNGQDSQGVYVWTAFASGDWARELLHLGEARALQHGIDTLRTELGRPTLQPQAAHLVNWPADPFARGGYSVTPPGGIDARAELARPLDHRLYWAGEATAPLTQVSTVHGALVSGRRTAVEILKDIQR